MSVAEAERSVKRQPVGIISFYNLVSRDTMKGIKNRKRAPKRSKGHREKTGGMEKTLLGLLSTFQSLFH